MGIELGVMCRGGELLTTRAGNYFCNPLAAGADEDGAQSFSFFTLGKLKEKSLQRKAVFSVRAAYWVYKVICTELLQTCSIQSICHLWSL